jgi:hypothetical protein
VEEKAKRVGHLEENETVQVDACMDVWAVVPVKVVVEERLVGTVLVEVVLVYVVLVGPVLVGAVAGVLLVAVVVVADQGSALVLS